MHDGAVDRQHGIDERLGQRALVRGDRLHCRPDDDGPARLGRGGETAPEPREVLDDRFHSRDVLVRIRAGFKLVWRHVRDEVFTKNRQAIDRLGSAPRKPHVR